LRKKALKIRSFFTSILKKLRVEEAKCFLVVDWISDIHHFYQAYNIRLPSIFHHRHHHGYDHHHHHLVQRIQDEEGHTIRGSVLYDDLPLYTQNKEQRSF